MPRGSVYFTAIVPKGPIVNPNAPRDINQALKNWAERVKEEVAIYPPWTPWKSRPPKTGPRAGGRTTGALGRAWRIESSFGCIKVVNDIDYSPYVVGVNQVSWQRERGWPRLQEIGQKHTAQLKADLRAATGPSKGGRWYSRGTTGVR